jgi:hypothetical protein
VQGKKVPSVKKDGEIIPRAGILWLTGSWAVLSTTQRWFVTSVRRLMTWEIWLISLLKTHHHHRRSNSSLVLASLGLFQAWGSAAVSHHYLLLIYFSSRVVS